MRTEVAVHERRAEGFSGVLAGGFFRAVNERVEHTPRKRTECSTPEGPSALPRPTPTTSGPNVSRLACNNSLQAKSRFLSGCSTPGRAGVDPRVEHPQHETWLTRKRKCSLGRAGRAVFKKFFHYLPGGSQTSKSSKSPFNGESALPALPQGALIIPFSRPRNPIRETL